MALMASKKIMLLAAALVINALLVFGLPVGYTISGLVQYGENIDRERLELLEDRQVTRITDNHYLTPDYFIIGTYTIRNRGNAYKATLGVLIEKWQGNLPSPAAVEMQFFIDSKPITYTEIITQNSVAMGEIMIENLPQFSYAWALIDVLFPENSVVTIRVQYVNTFDSYESIRGTNSFFYNARRLYFHFPELYYWKGPTKFSVEVINDYISRNNVEYYWISDIQFFHTEDCSKDIYTSNYLLGLQGLETDLMRIQKVNRNTFMIEFTEKFMNNYRRSITIIFSSWSDGIGYIKYDSRSKDINLSFGSNVNISQRELASYELIFLTNKQLRIMRNAFYARHGYVFRSRELQDMLNIILHDYVPNPNFHEGMLTEIDCANIATIQRLEAIAGEWE